MARSEPFRALLEEAFSDEGLPLPPSLDKPQRATFSDEKTPKDLGRRLDQVSLAGHGATPAKGTAVSPLLRLESGLSAVAPPLSEAPEDAGAIEVSPAARDLLDELDTTAKLDRPAAIDAALQDALAEPPVTMAVPSIFRQPTLNVPAQSLVPAREESASFPPKRELPRPPPLPARAKPKLVEVNALGAVETVAPVPKIMQVLEDVTVPGVRRPGSTSNSNNSGRIIGATDLYRLQLEFEDTPARPLPALASLPPPGARRLEAVQSVEDIEDIADLDALAQALGLEGVGDVSIPSAEGLLSDGDEQHEWNDVTDELPELEEFDDAILEIAPAINQATPTPVIVKIPSRPKVSVEAREQARRLYLSAVDELGRGDRFAAIGHLRLAVHYDDGIQLYKELLDQLEKTDARMKSEPPKRSGLMVVSRNGVETSARDRWRVGRSS